MQENVDQAAAGPVHLLISSGSEKRFKSDSQAAMKVKKDDSDSDVKNMSLKLSMQEARADTSTGVLRCAACQGTGAVMSHSQKSFRGVRENNSADK